MGKTILEVSHHQCTGCGACCSVCPVDAIQMVSDQEGFSFPQIDREKCVDCGKCLKTCPVHEPDYENRSDPGCYAVMAGDEIRRVSSSGGVFSLLAEWILQAGGYVCGAAFSEDLYSVEHILISSADELGRLRGSKYVQSASSQVFREIKKLLAAGKQVLFTGTPCQVAGIKGYLGKDYDNLFTLDLVCHGAPSPLVYRQFLAELEAEHGSKAVRVAFRDKSVTEWNHSILVEFENGQKYSGTRSSCPYLQSFLKLLTVRKSCGSCPFAKLPRQGDMTIADFWDIHRYKESLDDRKGTSLVLVNNEKGEKLLQVLQKVSVVCEKAPLDHAVKYNGQIVHPSGLHPRRERFFKLLTDYHYDVKKAVDYGMNRRFDVGLVGWWYGANYGSAMTSFALNRVLTSMGKSVLMLEWPIMNGNVPSKKPDTATRRFANHFYEMSMYTPISDYGRFNYHCESFVVGSDQLWDWHSNRDVGTYHFFLDFVDKHHKKIAYSTSFGHEFVHYPEEMRLNLSYHLQRFDAISVREKSAVEVCRRDFNVDAVQTMDPVFLCDMKSYDEAVALSKLKIDHPYVLAYILNPTEEKLEAVRTAAKKMDLPYYIILDGQGDFEKLRNMVNDPNVLPPIEIADWLYYIKHASFMVTDSFHGFCYATIFQRNMAVFPNKLRGLARFETISQLAGLEDRLVYSYGEYLEKKLWEKNVDYAMVEARMRPEIDRSREWLRHALDARKLPPSAKELQLWKILEFDQMANVLKKEGVIRKEDLQGAASVHAAQDGEVEKLQKIIWKQADEIKELRKQMDKILWLPLQVRKICRKCKYKLTAIFKK